MEHAFVVARHDFDELRQVAFPISKDFVGFLTESDVGVFLDQPAQCIDVVFFGDRFEIDHGFVTAVGKITCLVEDVGFTTAHTGSEVAACSSENDNFSACHVFAAVITDAFDDGVDTRVTHGETFTGDTADEQLSSGRAVERDVADDDVFLGSEGSFGVGVDGDATTAKALADVVVGVAFDFEGNAFRNESTDALASGTTELEVDRVIGQTVPVAFGDLIADDGADNAVGIDDRQLGVDFFAIFDGRFAQIE